MKLKVVACGVFEPYIKQFSKTSPHTIDSTILDAGLHERPNDLRLFIQEVIDETSHTGGYDAVVLLYGLCGMGTSQIMSRDIPVVIPRVHDCISLFLGSGEAYLKQFHKNPGTIYHTLGWIEKKINPKNKEAVELYRNFERDGWEEHPEFTALTNQFGEDNAKFVLAFLDKWKHNYSRAAYIDLGFKDEEKLVDFTKQMSKEFGWSHEVLQGDSDYVSSLLNASWSDDRVFILPPNSRSASSGDEKVFAAINIDDNNSQTILNDTEVVVDLFTEETQAYGIGLGIDAGGTYTDSVIYDFNSRKLLAKAKSLTTYYNLVEGIRNSISQLPLELLEQVEVTSLSTTLATNAIVEGRGYKVGLIALSPWDWTVEQIGHEPLINVPGAVSISGDIIEPLGEDECRKAVKILVEDDKCAAIVIGGYANIRNPKLANRAREIIKEMYDVPVICSHEVSRRLNAIHGVQTSIANARLLPVIRELIGSVHQAMADFGIKGRLMVVKGDGTTVDEAIARERPVETILSGPAASVSGAKLLTGLNDALVIDVGGTTTDSAIIEDGHASISEEGAKIGNWVMSIDAVEISTVGLGGDSRISFNRERKIALGPRRCIPFAYIASEYDSIKSFLKNFDYKRYLQSEDATPLDVLILSSPVVIDLTEKEEKLLDILSKGPVPMYEAALMMGLVSHILLPLKRLEDCGIVKRASLTPTDLLHTTGDFIRWDKEASNLAIEIFAGMYGQKSEDVINTIRDSITRRFFDEIILREWSYEKKVHQSLSKEVSYFLDKAFYDNGEGIDVKIRIRRPIVAIGAPAQSLVAPVQKHIDSQIIVPENADVANAVGAIGGETVVREEILIRPGYSSNYMLYGSDERIEFNSLEKATQKAVDIARDRAYKKALKAGANVPSIKVIRKDKLGSVSGGGKIFMERKISAVASGGAWLKLVDNLKVDSVV